MSDSTGTQPQQGGDEQDYTPNEHRGIVKNPNNPAHEADRINREKQRKGG